MDFDVKRLIDSEIALTKMEIEESDSLTERSELVSRLQELEIDKINAEKAKEL